jgi:high-affinity nickel permease
VSGRAPGPRARAIGAGIVVAEKTVFGAVSDSGSGLERFGGLFGTVVSAAFLLLIGLLNLAVLAGIVRVFASMRRSEYDEAELERQLANRGFFYQRHPFPVIALQLLRSSARDPGMVPEQAQVR